MTLYVPAGTRCRTPAHPGWDDSPDHSMTRVVGRLTGSIAGLVPGWIWQSWLPHTRALPE